MFLVHLDTIILNQVLRSRSQVNVHGHRRKAGISNHKDGRS